ncbi:MAG: hypothetical protein IKF83_03965 [Clostridia bacterium]|nr:hypothetical protein [Clostridia bacterium]
MKLTNQKGITLIALTITIIVLLIIAGISVYTGSKLIQEAKLEDVKTNMLLVQAETKNFIEQAKFERKTIENLITEGISVDNVTLKLEATNENGQTYYKIIQPTMNELKLSKLSSDNYLLAINIDEVSVDVYFKPGIKDGEGTTYHLLSEMQ